MTPATLKNKVNSTGSYFFTADSMRFFGDTMSNYGVREDIVSSCCQKNIPVWELYRINPVKHGMQKSAYFAIDDYRRILKEVK